MKKNRNEDQSEKKRVVRKRVMRKTRCEENEDSEVYCLKMTTSMRSVENNQYIQNQKYRITWVSCGKRWGDVVCEPWVQMLKPFLEQSPSS